MIKSVHVTTVAISLVLFIGRGVYLYILRQTLTNRWHKIVPHVNDTVLLITGIYLATQIQQYPVANSWLTVKIGCLLLYIILGMMAMKWFRTTTIGLISWVAAILVFIFMLSVALSRSPAGLFV